MTPTPKKLIYGAAASPSKRGRHYGSTSSQKPTGESVQYVKDLSHTMQLIIKEVDDLKTALAVRTKELEESKRRESKLKEELQLQKHLVRVARQGPLRNGDEEDEDEEDEDESDVSLDTSIPAPKTCLRKRK